MRTLQNYLVIFIFLSLTIFMTACSGGGNCNTSSTPQNNLYYLGELPNGSLVYTDNDSFTTATDNFTSGILGLQGGESGASYLMSFSVAPTGPEIICKKTPCVLTAGGLDNVVAIDYKGNNATAGTYCYARC